MRIKVDDLCKRYGEKETQIQALDHVSAEIGEGEFVAVMGASGSGKSTFLHMLGGLDTPTQGTVSYDGKNIYQMKDGELSAFRLHHIGFVFQAYNLFPELTVYENIMLPLSIDHRKKSSEAEEVMDRLGLRDRRNHLPGQLSGGQQQRTAIARAMVAKPDVLLCDEPTGNLDQKSGESVMELLQMLNREQGITIVMVTHDRKLAEKTERVLEIVDGRIC